MGGDCPCAGGSLVGGSGGEWVVWIVPGGLCKEDYVKEVCGVCWVVEGGGLCKGGLCQEVVGAIWPGQGWRRRWSGWRGDGVAFSRGPWSLPLVAGSEGVVVLDALLVRCWLLWENGAFDKGLIRGFTNDPYSMIRGFDKGS